MVRMLVRVGWYDGPSWYFRNSEWSELVDMMVRVGISEWSELDLPHVLLLLIFYHSWVLENDEWRKTRLTKENWPFFIIIHNCFTMKLATHLPPSPLYPLDASIPPTIWGLKDFTESFTINKANRGHAHPLGSTFILSLDSKAKNTLT